MKTVWKYILEPGEISLDIPVGAQILSVAVQGEDVCLWALVAPHESTESRDFIVVGTGEQIPDKYQPSMFIGTVHLSPFLVFHVFERTRNIHSRYLMSGSKNYSVERKKNQARLTAKLGIFTILPIFCIYLLEHKTNIFPSFIFPWVYIAGLIIYLIGTCLIHLKFSNQTTRDIR